MPEWMTPLLRLLVAMPNLGNCSIRKRSGQRRESASAMAQPTTPPPMIKMLTWSIPYAEDFCGTFTTRVLTFLMADFIEESLARFEVRLGAVVHGKLSAFGGLVAIFPERGTAVFALFIQGVEIKVEGS